MGCETCSNKPGGVPNGCQNNGTCASGGCSKLAVYDWLGNMELPGHATPFEYVEIRFKNGRKDFFRNATKTNLNPGDVVAVEANPGYDMGTISASGELARLQMETKGAMKNARDLKTVIRTARTEDFELWREARSLESDAMQKGRTIAIALGLEMKISDVEYQGDKQKATFYYTADGRVDFRELIKKFADAFRVRIEMKQIGARQEAGRLGGIGSCGRELCCSTWLTDFRSVSTSAARYQQLSLNTQKLAGQCGKLKCCLNYELDTYQDALKGFPKNFNRLKTKKGTATHFKTDIFKGMLWYFYDEGGATNPVPINKDRVAEILEMNAAGEYPDNLLDFVEVEAPKEEAYGNVVGQDSLTRFDELKKPRGKNKKRKGNRSKPRNPNAAQAKGGEPDQKSNHANRPKKSRGPHREIETSQEEKVVATKIPKHNRAGHGGLHFLILMLVLAFSACQDEQLVFEKNVEIPGARWFVADKAILDVDIQDTVSQHNFLINVRNTEKYPFRNLYVFVKTKFPNGKTSKDTVGIVLADATGRWLGKGSGFLNSSQHLSNAILFKYNKRFPISGTYTFEIEQAMRMDTLDGIQNVGLRIEKSKPSQR